MPCGFASAIGESESATSPSLGGGVATHSELPEGGVGSGWRRGELSIFGNGVRIPDWMQDNEGEFPKRKHLRMTISA